MTQQLINTGAFVADPNADTIRAGFIKVNSNFTDVYALNASVFNVLLYGALGNGLADDASAIQAAINAAYAAGGGIVYLPPTGHYYLISAGLTLPSGVCLMGSGTKNSTRPAAHTPATLAQKGSWILCTDSSDSAVTFCGPSGVNADGLGDGARIVGVNFVYNQTAEPSPDSTSWTPITYPYCIKMTGQWQSVENIQIVNATHGISIDGSNVTGGLFGGTGVVVQNVNMHVYNVGIKIDTVVDSLRIHDVNVENIIGGIFSYNYMLANLIGFDFHRCDNPWISDIQIFAAICAMRFTDGTDGSARSMTNATLSNLQVNLCVVALQVSSTSTFVSGQFANCFFQNNPLSFILASPNTPAAGTLLSLNSDNISLNFSSCLFGADNIILTLGNGGAGTDNGQGFPNCTFSSCSFIANSGGSSGAAFDVRANAKVSTAAQYFNVGLGSIKTGSGTMVKATETTSL